MEELSNQRLEKKNNSSPASWRKRGLLALGSLVFLATAGAVITATMSPRQTSSKLTHTIQRRDITVTVVGQGLLESSENTEIKCKVRGKNTVIWVIESGTVVKPGDELIRLDTLFIEEQIDERTKYAHWSRSGAERSLANVARAKLELSEYENGTYIKELMRREKDLVIAEAALKSSENMLSHAIVMAKSDFTSKLEVEEKDFSLRQAKLDVSVKKTELDILKQFTRKERLLTLQGGVASSQASHKANAERAMADASRRDRALEEIQYCVVKAERGGLVIHPNAAKWETAPIAEGTRVYKDQILLLMPDLSKMQVKLGIHESVVDRLSVGLKTRVMLSNETFEGSVSSVASVAKPASMWSGDEVKYDTLVEIPSGLGLKPGMSAEVEIIIAEYQDVLAIPVAAVFGTDENPICWVKTAKGTQRRPLKLGDSNDIFTIIKKGLKEGDEVILNPIGLGELQESTEQTSEKQMSDQSATSTSEFDSK